MLCTQCAKTHTSDVYKVCDRCRQDRAEYQRKRGLVPPFSTLSDILPERRICSNCGKSWQSSQCKTCDVCRATSARKRARAADMRRFSPSRAPAKRRCPPDANDHLQSSADPLQIQNSSNQAIKFLRDEYTARVASSESFPPSINHEHIRRSVTNYEDMMSEAGTRNVCSCCGKLVHTNDIYYVNKMDPRLQPWKDCLDL